MEERKGEKMHISMNCNKQGFSETMARIVEECRPLLQDDNELKFRVKMAAREMLANALEHGCSCEKEQVMIVLTLKSSKIKLKVISPGSGFDWKNIILNYMPALETEGRGLPMIKIAADKITFNEKGNIITAIFKSQKGGKEKS